MRGWCVKKLCEKVKWWIPCSISEAPNKTNSPPPRLVANKSFSPVWARTQFPKISNTNQIIPDLFWYWLLREYMKFALLKNPIFTWKVFVKRFDWTCGSWVYWILAALQNISNNCHSKIEKFRTLQQKASGVTFKIFK